MPCSVVKFPNGAIAMVKHAGPRPRRCRVCGTKTTQFKLCDYVLTRARREEYGEGASVSLKERTCSVVLCDRCAVHVRPDTDYCPLHADALGVNGRRLRL